MRKLIIAALAAGLLTTATTSRASAQSFWSPMPELNSVYDKVLVRFPTNYNTGNIVVSFSDRRLYHVIGPGRAISYPIAIPRAQSRWQGTLRVSHKRVNPPWTPTPAMRRENPKLPAFVPGGDPRNPMGARALYLGSTLYRIHGTDAPWTIGQNVSKGCIRMHNSHVIELFDRVRVGASVLATWKPYRAKRITGNSTASSIWSN